jgi:Glycosyl hydrolases family 16
VTSRSLPAAAARLFLVTVVASGLVAVVFLAAPPVGSLADDHLNTKELDLSRYRQTFFENFSDLSISDRRGTNARWYAHTPWNGDFGDARFVAPGERGPFSKLPVGMRITASKGADGIWRSGLISSRDHDGFGGSGFAQQYGYFEIKAKLPDGDGVWPAFWLIGVDKTRAASEIDVIEYYGRFPEYYHATTHIWKKGGDRAANSLIRVPKNQLTSQYNTFGVSIEPDITTFYLNRRPVHSERTPEEYRQPFYILANLALGGGWPITGLHGDQAMDIEYIAVFQKTDRQGN